MINAHALKEAGGWIKYNIQYFDADIYNADKTQINLGNLKDKVEL